MKKFILIFLLSIFFVSCSTVKETGKFKITEESGFLWKVKSSTATVFLFGSIHVAREDMYPLSQKTEDAFESSDALVVELDINKVDPALMRKKAMYQDDRTLESELSKETYRKLEALLLVHKVPKTGYYKLKPWMAMMTVLLLELNKAGFDKSLGLDNYFLEKSKNKKEILELENAEEQLDLLDIELGNLQNEFIDYSLLDQSLWLQQIDTLVNLWKTGNVKEMEKYVLEPMEEHPEFEIITDKLYTQRNIRMAKKIEDYLKTNKTYFVVVGAAHLIGDEGIVELLRKSN
ncbi:MAG: TraB/GumN family protein [bacterium]